MTIAEEIREHLGHQWSDRSFVQSEKVRDIMRRGADEIARLRAALEFYADPFGWPPEDGNPIAVPDFYSELDFGAKAQEALNPK